MFLVTDKMETRRAKILGFLDKGEPAIAVLLAAADCERTVRRAILALGVTPTRELQHRLGRPRPKDWIAPIPKPPKYGSSIRGYDKAWSVELCHLKRNLLGDVAGPAETLHAAFQLRHDLIHGDRGTTGKDFARTRVERLLNATSAVSGFARECGVDLEKPLKKRTKPRKVS